MADIWPLTPENMWLPVEVWFEISMIGKSLDQKIKSEFLCNACMSSLGTKYQFFHWLCIGIRNIKSFKLQFLLSCTWYFCPWHFQRDKNNALESQLTF